MPLRRDGSSGRDGFVTDSRSLRRVTRTALFLVASALVLGAIGAGSPNVDAHHAESAPSNDDGSLSALLGLPPDVPVITEDLPASLTGFAWRFAAAAQAPLPTETPVPPPPPAPPAPTATPVVPSPTPVHVVVQQHAPPPPPPPPPPTSTPVPPPPPPPPTPAPAPTGLDLSPMNSYEQALFDAVNARRVAAGLPALRPNIYLTGVGRVRSQDMVDHNYFAHVSPVTGDDVFALMRSYGIPFAWAGENLALNNYGLDRCVQVADQALWDSPPHRSNSLGEHYTDMGVALRSDRDGRHYFTIVFTGP